MHDINNMKFDKNRIFSWQIKNKLIFFVWKPLARGNITLVGSVQFYAPEKPVEGHVSTPRNWRRTYWWWRWPRTFIVNTDTCDRGGSYWVAFHFPLVGPAKFFDSLGSASETYHHRFANVLIVNGPQYYYCSSRIQPDDTDTCGLYCLYYLKRRHRGMELPDIVKDFSTIDLKGNEDKILRSNC